MTPHEQYLERLNGTLWNRLEASQRDTGAMKQRLIDSNETVNHQRTTLKTLDEKLKQQEKFIKFLKGMTAAVLGDGTPEKPFMGISVDNLIDFVVVNPLHPAQAYYDEHIRKMNELQTNGYGAPRTAAPLGESA